MTRYTAPIYPLIYPLVTALVIPRYYSPVMRTVTTPVYPR